MKTKITFFTIMLAFFGWNNLNAQSLFKDLNPGPTGTTVEQFTNVNGVMYFIAVVSYRYQLWKSDGTVANTVMVKDSLVTTNSGLGITIRGNIGDTLFYTNNVSGTLWKSHGGTPEIIDTINGSTYTIIGNKIFITVGNSLWISDGTNTGTNQVISMAFIGESAVYNGKLYFQGSNVTGNHELYSSDGTLAGTSLVKEIFANTSMYGGSDPQFFIVYNNELYFYAYDGTNYGIFKTDGTSAGTVYITNSSFNNNAKIFQNKMYFSVAGNLWVSDGTAIGTMLVKDSAGYVTGISDNYFFTSYMKTLFVPPYFEMYYWKSDGTTAGTVRVSDSLGTGASFITLNNKMYNRGVGSGYSSILWETDGTEAGTNNIITGYLSLPFVFNNTIFFSNFQSATGYELWSYTPNSTGISESTGSNTYKLNIYPNPSSGIVNIDWSGDKNAFLTVFNMMGEEVQKQQCANNIDLSNQPKGIYVVKISDSKNSFTSKIIVQ